MMKFRDFDKKHGIIFVIAVIVLFVSQHHSLQKENPTVLTEQAKQHILYGDSKGGGHIYGANVPCKSEFPKNWNPQKIISTVKKQAANDNLSWEKQRNGYYVSENTYEKINVRVVLGKNKHRIVTAYPTNQPRNPCQ